MTELDDLKAKWEAHDLQLEKILRLNHELLSLAKLQPAESQLRRVGIYAGLEAAMWLVIVVALGNFIADHIRMPGLGGYELVDAGLTLQPDLKILLMTPAAVITTGVSSGEILSARSTTSASSSCSRSTQW